MPASCSAPETRTPSPRVASGRPAGPIRPSPARCGLRVALILDLSGSVGPDTARPADRGDDVREHPGRHPVLGRPVHLRLQRPAPTRRTTRTGPSRRSRPPPAPPPSTAGSTASPPSRNDQFTNWDRALNQVTESAQTYDVASVVTDGNPTAYGVPPSQTRRATRFREVENGIFSANGRQGRRAPGSSPSASETASGGSGQNLRSISGPTLGSDYFQTTDYPEAAGVLRALALGGCQGTVSVIKQVIPPRLAPSPTPRPPAAGSSAPPRPTSGVTIAPASGLTAAGTGGINFGLTFPGGTTSAPVTVTETQQAGYTLVQQAGANATCRRLDTQAAVPTTNVGALGFQLTADPADSDQLHRLQPGSEPAGHRAGQQAVDRQRRDLRQRGAAARVVGPAVHRRRRPSRSARSSAGFTAAQTVAINETVTNQLAAVHGDRSDGHPRQRDAGERRAAVQRHARGRARTPTRSPTSSPARRASSSTKTVAGGTALPDGVDPHRDRTGRGAGRTDRRDRCHRQRHARRRLRAGRVGREPELRPGRPAPTPCRSPARPVSGGVSWSTPNGAVIPGFSDGINGGVTVPLGQRVQCTAATNRAARRCQQGREQQRRDGRAGRLDPDGHPDRDPTPGRRPPVRPGSDAGTTFRPSRPGLLPDRDRRPVRLRSSCRSSARSASRRPLRDHASSSDAGESGVCTYTNDDAAGHADPGQDRHQRQRRHGRRRPTGPSPPTGPTPDHRRNRQRPP